MSAYSASTAQDVVKDVGVLTHDVASSPVGFGVSRGGITFTPSIVYESVNFDGKRTDHIEGLTRVKSRNGKIAGTFIQVSVANMKTFEPGASLVTTTLVNTFTPQPASALLAAGAFLDNLTWTLQRGDGATQVVKFAKALCTKYDLKSTDNGEVEVSCEFDAVLSASAAATSLDASPYTIVTTTAS